MKNLMMVWGVVMASAWGCALEEPDVRHDFFYYETETFESWGETGGPPEQMAFAVGARGDVDVCYYDPCVSNEFMGCLLASTYSMAHITSVENPDPSVLAVRTEGSKSPSALRIDAKSPGVVDVLVDTDMGQRPMRVEVAEISGVEMWRHDAPEEALSGGAVVVGEGVNLGYAYVDAEGRRLYSKGPIGLDMWFEPATAAVLDSDPVVFFRPNRDRLVRVRFEEPGTVTLHSSLGPLAEWTVVEP